MTIEDIYPSFRRGVTVSPTYDPVTGEMGDMAVGIGHAPTSPFADHTEVPEDLLGPDAFESQSADDFYRDAIAEHYNLEEVLAYHDAWLSPQLKQDFIEADERGDYDKLLPLIETLHAEWLEGQQSNEIQPQEQTFEPPSEEEIDTAMDTLMSQEVLGTEVAYQYLQQAEQATSPTEKAVLMATASFHRGEADAGELIDDLIDKYDFETLVKVAKKYA